MLESFFVFLNTISAHSSNNGEQGGNTEQQLQQTRNNLLKKIDALSISISEQQNFIVSLKYVIENTWMSAAASREALIDSFPDVLLHPVCLKLPLLFRLMRETFQMLSIPIEARQGLYVPQAVADALYASDNVIMNTAHRYLSDYRHAADGAARGQGKQARLLKTHLNLVELQRQRRNPYGDVLMLPTEDLMTQRNTAGFWPSLPTWLKQGMRTLRIATRGAFLAQTVSALSLAS